MNPSGLKSKDHMGTACRRQQGVRSVSLQVKAKQENIGCASQPKAHLKLCWPFMGLTTLFTFY